MVLQNSHFEKIQWKAYIRKLLLAMKEDYPDRKAQSCEWSQKNVQWVAEFVGRTVFSDKVSNAFAGPLKSIHEERQWIYHDFWSGVWHPRVLMDTSFSKEELLALCSLTTFWHPLCLPLVSCKGIRNFLINKKRHLHIATQISQNSSMKISCPLDMTKGKCWVPQGAPDLNPLDSHVT